MPPTRASRNKLLSVASRLKSLADRGKSEDDQNKQMQILFSLFHELANALKIQAEMGRNEVNVSTAGVLDIRDIQSELKRHHNRS